MPSANAKESPGFSRGENVNQPEEVGLHYSRLEQHTPGEDCFCKPRRLQVCPECNYWAEPPRDCPKCRGEGLVPFFDPTAPYIVAHNTKLNLSEEQQRRIRSAMFRARHAIRKGFAQENEERES